MSLPVPKLNNSSILSNSLQCNTEYDNENNNNTNID